MGEFTCLTSPAGLLLTCSSSPNVTCAPEKMKLERRTVRHTKSKSCKHYGPIPLKRHRSNATPCGVITNEVCWARTDGMGCCHGIPCSLFFRDSRNLCCCRSALCASIALQLSRTPRLAKHEWHRGVRYVALLLRCIVEAHSRQPMRSSRALSYLWE